jgi:hypothetical protein
MNLSRFTGKEDQKTKTLNFFGSWFSVYHPSDFSSTTSLFPRRSLSLEARIVVEQHAYRHEQAYDCKATLAEAHGYSPSLGPGGL